MNKILITGATGKLGLAVIRHLLKMTVKERIIALVKDWTKAEELIMEGIEVRYGHYDDVASLYTAMVGIGKVLLISGTDAFKRLRQHQNIIDAAVSNGVRFIAYTGISIRDFQHSELHGLMISHFLTEYYLKASGVQHAIFRNTLYAEDLPYYIGQKNQFVNEGILFCAASGKVPFALREEMAEAFANLMLRDDDETLVYEIGNSKAFSFQDIADALTMLMDKTILYTGHDALRYAEVLSLKGYLNHIAVFLTHTSRDISDGRYEIVTGDLERLLGRRPAGLKDILKKVFAL